LTLVEFVENELEYKLIKRTNNLLEILDSN
jgi:hypothetical protein